MLSYKNLTLLGTSHISSHSIKQIERAFNELEPAIIAVELDKRRLYALMHDQKPNYSLSMISSIGLQGYLFAVIGNFLQQKMGNIVGIKPGSDMLSAVQLAMKKKKRIALIDRDLSITLKRLNKAFGWKEKFNLLIDIFRSPFSKRMRIDLRKVPQSKLINLALRMLKKRYPGLHRVLVSERNQIMARKLAVLMQNHHDEKILGVIGAGHEEEMLRLLKKYENKI